MAKFAKEALWVQFGTLLAAILSVGFQLILSLRLSDEAFGESSVVFILGSVAGLALALGSQNVALNLIIAKGWRVERYYSSYLRYFAAFFGVGLLSAVLAFGFNSRLWYAGSTALAMAVLLAGLTIIGSGGQAVGKFRVVALAVSLPELAKALVVAVLYVTGGWTAESLYQVSIVVLLVSSLILGFLLRQYSHGSAPGRFRDIGVLGIPYALAALIFMLHSRVSVIIVAVVGGSEEAGSLAIITLFASAFLLLPSAYSQKYDLGSWHHLFANSKDLFIYRLRSRTLAAVLFGSLIALAWVLVVPPLLELFYESRYPEASTWAAWFGSLVAIKIINLPLQAATSVERLKWWRVVALLFSLLTGVAVLYLGYSVVSFGAVLPSMLVSELVLLFFLLFTVSRARRAD